MIHLHTLTNRELFEVAAAQIGFVPPPYDALVRELTDRLPRNDYRPSPTERSNPFDDRNVR